VAASTYPLARVWTEVEITTRRRNGEIRAQAALDFSRENAIHGGKKASAPWKQAMKDLADGG